jgi:CheY-like chemotaxis protein
LLEKYRAMFEKHRALAAASGRRASRTPPPAQTAPFAPSACGPGVEGRAVSAARPPSDAADEIIRALHGSELPVRLRVLQRILLVDDDPDLLELTSQSLLFLGHDVTPVLSPAAALRLVAEGEARFDVALTDLFMPGMDGFALAAALRQVSPALRIHLFSSAAGEIAPDDPRRSLVDSVVLKPLSIPALDLLLSP